MTGVAGMTGVAASGRGVRDGAVRVAPPTASPAANAAVNAAAGALDSATRLPGRSATLGALQCLQARRGGHAAAPLHLCAVQVTLPACDASSRLDRTLTDLAACRAAELLRRHLPPALVFGRTRRDSLLYVCAGGEDGGKDGRTAERLTRALGSLGELVDQEGDLRVDVLNGSADAVARPDLADRLERRAQDALLAGASGRGRTLRPAHRAPADDVPIRPPAAVARDAFHAGTRAATRYIGEATKAPEPPLDDSLVPILTQKSATARFARPAADAWP